MLLESYSQIKQNVMDVSYHIAQYTNIIAELRTEIQRLHRKLDQRSLTDNRNSSAIQAIQCLLLKYPYTICNILVNFNLRI